MTIPRYPPTFRQDEIQLICQSALTGESLCFVGLAGSGKSNIMNFLCVDPYGYKSRYLGQQPEQVLFLCINTEAWDGSALSLWELLYSELWQQTQMWAPAEPESKIIQLSEEARVFSKLQEQVDLVCGTHQSQLMFILDDFDRVIEVGPLSMLEQLNRLRSSHRGRVSYLIFTKKLPHVLGRAHNLERNSKFYDLFKNHVYALPLYGSHDVRQMLLHLNSLNNNQLGRDELLNIEALCGGHARLLRLLFDAWLREPPPHDVPIERYYAHHPDLQKECARILHGLHRHERRVAVALARGEENQADWGVIYHLQRRGLLIKMNPPHWFSPLMAIYLQEQGEGGAP